jgi:hypothetical protein
MSFYAFVLSSSRFRRQVKFVLLKKCWQPWKLWCRSRHNRIGPQTSEIHGVNLELVEDV